MTTKDDPAMTTKDDPTAAVKLFKIFTTSGTHTVYASSPDEARKLFAPNRPRGCVVKKIKLVKEPQDV